MIALIFPPDTAFPLPSGAWHRNAAGEIVLRCDRAQLAAALEIADAIGLDRPRQTAATTETAIDSILRSYDAHGEPWLIRY